MQQLNLLGVDQENTIQDDVGGRSSESVESIGYVGHVIANLWVHLTGSECLHICSNIIWRFLWV